LPNPPSDKPHGKSARYAAAYFNKGTDQYKFYGGADMKDIFLLGAGASVEAKVPDAYSMTKELLKRFESPRLEANLKVLNFVMGGLLFNKGIRGESPLSGINVEDLFNAVETLAKRDKSELGPFIGSWHPHLNELETGNISMADLTELMDRITEEVDIRITQPGLPLKKRRWLSPSPGSDEAEQEFQKLFTKVVRQAVTARSGGLLEGTARKMLIELTRLVWIDNKKNVDYLIPLVSYALSSESTIVTLNYDNSIEYVGEISGIKIDTGFENWYKEGEFQYAKGTVPLIKLHGSIDWQLVDNPVSKVQPIPQKKIIQISKAQVKRPKPDYDPAIIFGGINKLTAEGPFLDLLRTFANHLNQSTQLTVIGYSFRDPHINKYIREWINGRPDRILRVIDPYLKENEITIYLKIYKKTRYFPMKKKASTAIKEITKPVTSTAS
jgi:hypothetical protein